MNKVKKTSFLLSVLMVFVLILSSCSGAILPGEDLMKDTKPDENSAYKFINGKTEIPTSYASYKNYAADFAFSLLKASYKSGENTIIPTAGLYSQLSLIENAVSDSSLRELKALTGKNQPLEELNECNAYFFARLKKLSSKKKGGYVDLNNNLFFNTNVRAGQQFLLTNADYYRQGLFQCDFSDKATYEKINAYISEQTGEKFKSVLKSAVPDNAGYISTGTSIMRDKWLSGYDKQDTKTAEFNGANNKVQAQYMTSTEFFLKGKHCIGFEKSFKNTPCKFIALLPDEKTSLYKLIDTMRYDEYQNIVSSMNVLKTCEASLPQFSVNYEDELTDELNKCGVYGIFNQKGSLKNLSFNQKGSLGGIYQSFELSINEAGIGAAKPNLTKTAKKAADVKVTLDRPFVFFIVDNESYIPLFAGVVTEI